MPAPITETRPFVCVGSRRGYAEICKSERTAINKAQKMINEDRYEDTICVYKLVKVVRREVTPVKVEEVSF